MRSGRKPVGRGTRARKKDRGSGRGEGEGAKRLEQGDSVGRIDGPGN